MHVVVICIDISWRKFDLRHESSCLLLQATEEELDVEKAVKKDSGVKLMHSIWGHTLYHRDDLPFAVQQ